jgi:hypothetical protein
MDIITADFETYYDKEFSLSKMTMEAYVRDPRFEVIMLGLRWPDGTKEIVTGTEAEIQYRLDAIEWDKYAVLAHNTLFDAAILSWRFGVNPRAWLDTLSMARAMFGMKGNSLALLARRYGLEDKGTAVQNAMGKRRADFTPQEFKQYADYCLHDAELCHELFFLMSNGWYKPETFDHRDPYPVQELKLIDKLIRMYTEPVLRLNKERLEEHLADVVRRKEELLSNAGIAKEDLMSNPKFALVLEDFGVTPPMKTSPTTGKQAFAFAKTDPGMKALLEHPDERVQAVVAARMGVKSTLEETRTQRFIDMAGRSPLFPVPLRYSAARTHRLGGCLVADTEVSVYDPGQDAVTSKKITDVLADDLVWDGQEFVTHGGVAFMGFDEVITYDGVTGTSDHRVFTADGEKTLGEAASSRAPITVGAGVPAHVMEAGRRLFKRKAQRRG